MALRVCVVAGETHGAPRRECLDERFGCSENQQNPTTLVNTPLPFFHATHAAILLMLSSHVAARADVVLVKDGNAAQPIYLAATPSPLERTAATELGNYLGKLSGAKFTISTAPNPLPDTGIFVGAFDNAQAAELGPDDFRIRAQGQRLHIVGGRPQATLCGVFAFLEEQLGCRWWSYDEEDLPAPRATILVPELDRVTRAAFAIHNVWNREAQSPKNQFVYKARTTSAESISGGHTLYPLLTEYGATHPEIYPMDKEEQRKPNKLHFCYIAPGIAEALAGALAKQVEAKKGDVRNVIYFAGMGDWYGGMCECEACKKIYEEETWTDPDGRKKSGVTATLLRMINKTAELLEKRYPGIRIGTFAYMSLEAPPAKTVPRENVVIRVPRLRHCTVHPARECEKNASFARNVERWCQIAPGRVYIWEYAASFKNFMYPFPCLFSMADNLKFYHERGIRGVEIQGNYVSTGSDLVVLKNYVWRKIFWQPDRDPRELVREFCRGYYGPAADDMVAYVEAIEKSVIEPKKICGDEFGGPAYLTADVRARMEKFRDQALARVKGQEPFERRIHEAAAGLEAVALWNPGPLEERDGRLVRKDLGGDTFPRAQELLKYIRGASPSEFSSGRAWQLIFQGYHGGPLVTLAHGPLSVKVAPVINGQLRQIIWQDKPLLHVENNAKLKGFPFLGGSFDGGGTRIMNIEGEPSARKVRLSGESGVGAFNSVTKQMIWKTVELPDEGGIAITGTVRRVAKTGDDKRGATVTTAYAVGKKLPDARVEYLSEAGKWEELKLAGEQTEWPLPALQALKIHLPEQQCTVMDRYVFPATSGGKIAIDPKAHTLTTTVTTTPADAPVQGENKFLERQIQILPE